MKNFITTLAESKIQEIGEESTSFREDFIGIINAVIGVIGLVAVIVIIVGGVTYMTSSGDPQKVKKAKDTILYGIIGMIVCALAFAIVNFVISNILNGGN